MKEEGTRRRGEGIEPESTSIMKADKRSAPFAASPRLRVPNASRVLLFIPHPSALIPSKRPDGATREFAFEVCVALFARDQFTQDFSDACVRARELDHSFGEGRAPEVSVKAAAHLCGSPQLSA